MSKELLVVMMIMFSLVKCQTGKEMGTFFDKEIDPKKLAIEYKITTGKELQYHREYQYLYPWLATKFNTGNKATWLLLLIYPGFDVPDVSYVEAHVFNENWKLITKQSFPTGYRQSIHSAYVTNVPQLQQDVLVVEVVSTGPFIETNGEKKPVFHQGNSQRQYYAFADNQFFLIRMVDDQNKLVRNSYRSAVPWKGPSPTQFNKELYFTNLNSQNPVQVLQTLVWLTGLHLSSKVKRLRSFSQEPVEASKLFEIIRKDIKTQKVLQKLRVQKNTWIKEYATLEILEEDHTEPPDFLDDDE